MRWDYVEVIEVINTIREHAAQYATYSASPPCYETFSSAFSPWNTDRSGGTPGPGRNAAVRDANDLLAELRHRTRRNGSNA